MSYECFLQKCTVGSEREKDGPKSTGKVKEYGLTQERIVVPLITGISRNGQGGVRREMEKSQTSKSPDNNRVLSFLFFSSRLPR